MDKYGEFYGRDRISELLGMDKAALDFSDAREKKKPKKDSSLSAVWVSPVLHPVGVCWKGKTLIEPKVAGASFLFLYIRGAETRGTRRTEHLLLQLWIFWTVERPNFFPLISKGAFFINYIKQKKVCSSFYLCFLSLNSTYIIVKHMQTRNTWLCFLVLLVWKGVNFLKFWKREWYSPLNINAQHLYALIIITVFYLASNDFVCQKCYAAVLLFIKFTLKLRT